MKFHDNPFVGTRAKTGKEIFNNQSAAMRRRLKYGETIAGSILKTLSETKFF
jgi:hypothetical protein